MMKNNIKDMNDGFNIVSKQSEAQINCPITHLYSFDDIKNNLLSYYKFFEKPTKFDIKKYQLFLNKPIDR